MAIISPVFARGLRKNFFESYQREYPSDTKNLTAALSYSGYPFKSKRDFAAYFNNTVSKLAKYAIYYDVKRTRTMIMHTVSVATPKSKMVRSKSGEIYNELYLEFEFYCLIGKLDDWSYEIFVCPIKMEVTSHTIERLFMRLATTKPMLVRDELASSIDAFMKIHMAVMFDKTWQTPNCIIIPTANGALLTDFSSERLVACVRTYIKEALFPFQDYSLNVTRKWVESIKDNDITKENADALLSHPSNRWWFDQNFDNKFTSRDPSLDLDLVCTT